MFASVGRSLDPWYAFRTLVAAWLVLCGIVVGGYAVLGYVFLRFLLWMFFALLALLFPIVNPISFDEFRAPVLVREHVREVVVDDGTMHFDIDEPPLELDMALPPPPAPPPVGPADADELVMGEVVSTRVLAKVLGTTSREGSLVDLLGATEHEAGILGVLSASGSTADVFGSGGLGEIGGAFESTGLSDLDVALGGVQGGVVSGVGGGGSGPIGGLGSRNPRPPLGGGAPSKPAAKVDWQELTFRRKPTTKALGEARCRARVRFTEQGTATRVRPTCEEDADVEAVRRDLSRWRIEPWIEDGEAVPVETTIFLPFEG